MEWTLPEERAGREAPPDLVERRALVGGADDQQVIADGVTADETEIGGVPCVVCAPASAARTLVYFHGGGWVQGDLETHHGLCARLARHAGVLVVAVEYRLAPEHRFPAAVEDCRAAYAWVRARGREIGADPGRVAVAGDSAGGNLAAVVSQLAAASATPLPTCQALIYPALHFSLDTDSHRELVDGHLMIILPQHTQLGPAFSLVHTLAAQRLARVRAVSGFLRGLCEYVVQRAASHTGLKPIP